MCIPCLHLLRARSHGDCEHILSQRNLGRSCAQPPAEIGACLTSCAACAAAYTRLTANATTLTTVVRGPNLDPGATPSLLLGGILPHSQQYTVPHECANCTKVQGLLDGLLLLACMHDTHLPGPETGTP